MLHVVIEISLWYYMICDGCFVYFSIFVSVSALASDVIQIRNVCMEQLCFVCNSVPTTVQFQQQPLYTKAIEINLMFTEHTHKNTVSSFASCFRIRTFVFLTVVAVIVSSKIYRPLSSPTRLY